MFGTLLKGIKDCNCGVQSFPGGASAHQFRAHRRLFGTPGTAPPAPEVGDVHDEGMLFLWVTGRAMELARECLRRDLGKSETCHSIAGAWG